MCPLGAGDVMVGNALCYKRNVAKSAPIQPDLQNGPLWVPLEVANG